MVREEIAAFLKTAQDQLVRAEDDLEDGFYDSCALFSALCTENSTSALILALGSKPSKRHRNWYVLKIIPKPNELKETVNDILDILKRVEEHIIRTRYPLKDEKGRFIVPSQYYDKVKAEGLLKNAKNVLDKVEAVTAAIFKKET